MGAPMSGTHIIWRGASQLTGEPILVLLVHASGNGKTGPMSQTYILRADMTPLDAVQTSATSAICGDCPWQQNGCYAERSKGLISISARALATRGTAYTDISLAQAAESLRGRMLRLGAYGDPAAVPVAVWAQLCAAASGWTGYTHQWRKCDAALREYCMASCETADGANDAQARGWRTFRVRAVSSSGAIEQLAASEIVCPASAERDLITCSACGLCAGASKRGRNVAIINHSTSALAIRRKRGDLQVIQ
jgi:hypothetical protein